MAIDLKQIPTDRLKRVLELREQIDALTDELDRLSGGKAAAGPRRTGKPGRPKGSGKRVITPGWRAKISASQTRRWARQRAQTAASAAAAPAPVKRRKRTMTPAALAALEKAREARRAKAKARRQE